MTLHSQNPATGSPIKAYSLHTDEACETALSLCQDAWSAWRKIAPESRKELLTKLAFCLEENQEDYAHLMAEEMGKPVTQGLQEIKKCSWVLRILCKTRSKFPKKRLY